MSKIFALVLGFLGAYTCSADEHPLPLPLSNSKNNGMSNITETGNFEFTPSTGTPSSAERSTVVVGTDGTSTVASFIPALSTDCLRLLRDYADLSSSFMHCSLMHAKPMFVCERCVAEYKEAGYKFREIEKSGSCGGSLLSSDRVQILRETHNFAVMLWKKGSCDSCFKDMNHCNDSTKEGCPVTKKVLTFHKYINETLNCFREADGYNWDVCSNCSGIYKNLSRFYANMGDIEEICMDCVELMNSTQKEWSIVYNCTCTRKDVVSIVAISVFFCSLPLFFYIGSKVHTVKTEYKLMKQNRLMKPTQRPRPKRVALPAQMNTYLTDDTTGVGNSI